MKNSNSIYQLIVLEHIKATKSIRAIVARELRLLIEYEQDVYKKNLLQSAVDLIEFKI